MALTPLTEEDFERLGVERSTELRLEQLRIRIDGAKGGEQVGLIIFPDGVGALVGVRDLNARDSTYTNLIDFLFSGEKTPERIYLDEFRINENQDLTKEDVRRVLPAFVEAQREVRVFFSNSESIKDSNRLYDTFHLMGILSVWSRNAGVGLG